MATVEVDDNVAAALSSQANALGMSLGDYLRELATVPPQPTAAGPEAAAEFDALLDEFFSSQGKLLPISPLTYSRDDIYFDHD